jgi:hypothetical protein
MGSYLRDLIARFFGSEDVEMHFITPTSSTSPVPQTAAQPATLPAEVPSTLDEVAERRGSQPLMLRPAPQAE